MLQVSNNFNGYELNNWACIHVSGADTDSFLQSQFSNDLSREELPSATYGLWLNAKGRVLADSVILRFGKNNSYIFSENSSELVILEHLNKHIIADEVIISRFNLCGCFMLKRKNLVELSKALRIDGLANNGNSPFLFKGNQKIKMFRFPSKVFPINFDIIAFADPALYNFSINWIRSNSLKFMSYSQFHIARIKSSIPLIPEEIGPSDLAAEGNLVPNAVSLTKGCFLGQEVVARLYNLGNPQRQLFLITLDSREALNHISLPYKIIINDKNLGEIRTIYNDDEHANVYYAVAILKLRYLQIIKKSFSLNDIKINSICYFSDF